MSSEPSSLLPFVLFALAYTAAWWIVARYGLARRRRKAERSGVIRMRPRRTPEERARRRRSRKKRASQRPAPRVGNLAEQLPHLDDAPAGPSIVAFSDSRERNAQPTDDARGAVARPSAPPPVMNTERFVAAYAVKPESEPLVASAPADRTATTNPTFAPVPLHAPAAPANEISRTIPGASAMSNNPLDLPSWMEDASQKMKGGEPTKSIETPMTTPTPRAPTPTPTPTPTPLDEARPIAPSKPALNPVVPLKHPPTPAATSSATPSASASKSSTSASTDAPTTTPTQASKPAPAPTPASSKTDVPSFTAKTPSPSKASSNGSASIEPLAALARIEKERMQAMTQLDAWARTWAELEQKNAQCVDELTQSVDALAKEHAQCEARSKEAEERAQSEIARHASESAGLKKRVGELEPYVQTSKELETRCRTVEQELGTAKTALDEKRREHTALEERSKQLTGEIEKQKDHLARSQEATKEATARELDWQRRYHEDTKKLMQQLSAKTQEHERAQAEAQQRRAELERATGELRTRESAVQALTQQCSELEQRSVTFQDAIHDRDARLNEMQERLAALERELQLEKTVSAEQSALVEAAQGVLAELGPKMQLLEKKLGKH